MNNLNLDFAVDTGLHMKYANLWVSLGLITLSGCRDTSHTQNMFVIGY